LSLSVCRREVAEVNNFRIEKNQINIIRNPIIYRSEDGCINGKIQAAFIAKIPTSGANPEDLIAFNIVHNISELADRSPILIGQFIGYGTISPVVVNEVQITRQIIITNVTDTVFEISGQLPIEKQLPPDTIVQFIIYLDFIIRPENR
jgi:hypothetical protein